MKISGDYYYSVTMWLVGFEWEPNGHVVSHTTIDNRGTAHYYSCRLSPYGGDKYPSDTTEVMGSPESIYFPYTRQAAADVYHHGLQFALHPRLSGGGSSVNTAMRMMCVNPVGKRQIDAESRDANYDNVTPEGGYAERRGLSKRWGKYFRTRVSWSSSCAYGMGRSNIQRT